MSTALDLARDGTRDETKDGATDETNTFRGEYQQALRLIERLHRLLAVGRPVSHISLHRMRRTE